VKVYHIFQFCGQLGCDAVGAICAAVLCNNDLEGAGDTGQGIGSGDYSIMDALCFIIGR